MQTVRINLKLLSLVLIFALNFRLIRTQITDQPHQRCPEGYFLYTDELCYPNVRKPCPSETSTSAPVIGTTILPSYLMKFDCPEGSIMVEYKCRKVICSLGEYYRGRCLQPVCPQGLVWRGKKCQKPGYLTTVVEVNDVVINEVNETPIAVATSNGNAVIYEYQISTPVTASHIPFTTIHPSLPVATTTKKPKYLTMPITTMTKLDDTSLPQIEVCCKVFAPRICKLYVNKWLCFNRKYSRCDRRVCKSQIVYLKAPEIVYEPPLLIVPPNPNLNACVTDECYNNSTAVDCSGCTKGHSESCSPYCYMYICPTNSCTFIDLKEYCNIYPGQDACLPTNGCLWEWCHR